MGYTLIVNPGSSSKKYALYNESVLVLSMRFEQRGSDFEICTERNNTLQKCEGVEIAQFQNALDYFIDTALQEKIITKKEDIVRACVRVVAPGTYFQKHQIIDGEFVRRLRKMEDTAPLHIPMALREISYLERKLMDTELVSASDSAFHATMPPVTRNYSLPPLDAEELDMYRFGYHGISLQSVMRKVPKVFTDEPRRLIVCHIGSGVSVSAILDGKSFDTSMGYAPGGGLLMGTRAGDLESGALLELLRARHMRPFDAHMYLQTGGGLKALCGHADLRTVLERRNQGDQKAIAAFDAFAYHIRKTIGSYVAALGGLDALVVTATASERNPQFRSLLLRGLESLGIVIDPEKNDLVVNKDSIISSAHSPVDVAVIRTDEIDEMRRIAERIVL